MVQRRPGGRAGERTSRREDDETERARDERERERERFHEIQRKKPLFSDQL
jgi:hypothetical protein